MRDYLDRLAAHALDRLPAATPRIAARFEPALEPEPGQVEFTPSTADSPHFTPTRPVPGLAQRASRVERSSASADAVVTGFVLQARCRADEPSAAGPVAAGPEAIPVAPTPPTPADATAVPSVPAAAPETRSAEIIAIPAPMSRTKFAYAPRPKAPEQIPPSPAVAATHTSPTPHSRDSAARRPSAVTHGDALATPVERLPGSTVIERVAAMAAVAVIPQQEPRPRTHTGGTGEQPPAPAPAPTIHVSIGRIEVRATPPIAPDASVPSAPAIMGLDDYLRRRGGGGMP